MQQDIFKRYDKPQHTKTFKDKLIEERGHKCEKCNLSSWLNLPISLELHHIDGDKRNNTRENLELLCPNCHSYTDNYGSKNKKHSVISDFDLIQALQNSTTIREALLSLEMSDAGANYTRARKLIKDNNIKLLPKNSIKESFCEICGEVIYPGSTICVKCSNKKNRIVERPDKDILYQLLKGNSFCAVGRMYGVSDNAIRKWCKAYGLPTSAKEYKKLD